MNIFKKAQAALRFMEAIRQAEQAHSDTGDRYYVIPTTGKSGQLVIMDRANFRKLKQKGYIPTEAKVSDLEKECFYCTSYENGQGRMPDEIVKLKRKEYFQWLRNIENHHPTETSRG